VITKVLIGLNVLAFVYEVLIAGPGMLQGQITERAVLAMGALRPIDVTVNHEYWRIVTSAFLHANLLHIGVNMLSLYWLGRFIESAMGSVRMAAVYAVSLVVSGFGVVYFSDPLVPTLGASGAIYGLFGALFAIGLKYGRPGMDLVKANLGILVLNLVFTFASPAISKSAHIAGLIAGFALTLLIFSPPRPVRTRVVDASTGAVYESELEDRRGSLHP